jgi:hypothetical protein
MIMESRGGMIETEELGVKTCPCANQFNINPIRTDPVANPVLRDEMPAANHLSHRMALSVVTLYPYQSTIIISYISQKVFSFVT